MFSCIVCRWCGSASSLRALVRLERSSGRRRQVGMFVFLHGCRCVEACFLNQHCCEDNHKWEFCLGPGSIAESVSL